MGYQAALIVLSAIAMVLLVPPLMWHVKTLNIPLIALICWLLLMDINILVGAIIWGGPDFMTQYSGAGYCDVMVKLQVGANVGISSSTAGVMFNLCRIIKADRAIPAPRSFRKIGTDLVISLLTPVIVMGLNYLVQSRRYYVMQYSGCQNVASLSWVTVVVYSMWLVIWSFVGMVFSGMTVFIFFRKRKDVRDILKCTNSGLNIVRFAKLLSFCCVVILVMFPLSVYIFADNVNHVEDTFDFAIVHSQALWNLISFIPMSQPYFTTWIYMALSYVVFIFFGLGSDAVEMYLQILCKVGLAPVLQWVSKKRANRKINKADKLVNNILNLAHLGSPTLCDGGNSFDIEMQKAIREEEGDDYDGNSPASTDVSHVSNVFADKHVVKGLSGSVFQELDEEDMRYLNMLYEEDMKTDESAVASSPPEHLSQSKELDIGYSYVVKQKQ